MKIKMQFLLLFGMLLINGFAIGQISKRTSQMNNEIIFPKMIHYNRSDFNADPQFWTMTEDDNGMLLFGNNDGAIIFDGEHWKSLRLPNNSAIRSITKATDGKIYACGYNEIGTLQKNQFGNYFYKSFMNDYHLMDKNFENFWQVHQVKKSIVYRSFSELVIINDKRVTQIPANKSFVYASKVNNNYFVQDIDKGIYKLNENSLTLELIFDSNHFFIDELSAILPTQDQNSILLISKSGNVFFGNLQTKIISKKNNVFDGLKKDEVTFGIIYNNNYLLGTRGSKLLYLSNTGSIIKNNPFLQSISNANIHYLFQTQNNNIWVLQNNGLNFFDFKSPFVSIFDQASIYDILLKDNYIYAATNNGIFYANFVNLSENGTYDFKKIENLQGQTWSIQNLENDIIVSHDTGIYKLENGVAFKIGTQNGFWKITKIPTSQNQFLASNYNGLYLLEKTGNSWTIKQKISGFDESCRDILAAKEPNNYWVCHGYKGVYKIHINNDYTRVDVVDHFTNHNGLKSPYNINVFKYKNDIVFTTNTGIYFYNSESNKFESYKPLNTIFDTTINTRKLLTFGIKNWFIQDDEVGYFTNGNNILNKDLFLNLKGTFNRGLECIYPLDADNVLFGTNSGIYKYKLNSIDTNIKFPTLITQISYLQNQKSNFVAINSDISSINFPNQTDVIRFEFSSPKMLSSSEINYAYKLENVDENWSMWSKNAFKEYTHLPAGNYTFIVKSRNLAGFSGSETKFEFTVLPKWYQTYFAYFIYIISFLYLIKYIRSFVKNKIARERLQSQIELNKTQYLLELNLEKLKLKTDKEEIFKVKQHLELDIIDKSKELANYTLKLSQKKNIFGELQNDLKLLRDLLKSEEAKRKINEIFQKLNQHKIGEEYMEIFDVNFEKIHHDFFEKLKTLAPSLTKRELRLCAFIKMDMSNKEISPLLGISDRGVESARYRVRKKLNIAHDDSFVAFLENVKTETKK